MPSPAMPKTVSTPQAISVSTTISLALRPMRPVPSLPKPERRAGCADAAGWRNDRVGPRTELLEAPMHPYAVPEAILRRVAA